MILKDSIYSKKCLIWLWTSAKQKIETFPWPESIWSISIFLGDTRPIMSRVIQGYPCILVRLNHRDIYGALMGTTFYSEKWNSDSIEMILDKEATLRLKDLKRDFNSGLFRRQWIPACSIQHIFFDKRWRHHDVISKNNRLSALQNCTFDEIFCYGILLALNFASRCSKFQF